MTRTIEELNEAITSCRMLNKELKQEYNTTQPIMHLEVANAVTEHRNFWGPVSRYRILRQLVKTRRFTKTILP